MIFRYYGLHGVITSNCNELLWQIFVVKQHSLNLCHDGCWLLFGTFLQWPECLVSSSILISEQKTYWRRQFDNFTNFHKQMFLFWKSCSLDNQPNSTKKWSLTAKIAHFVAENVNSGNTDVSILFSKEPKSYGMLPNLSTEKWQHSADSSQNNTTQNFSFWDFLLYKSMKNPFS